MRFWRYRDESVAAQPGDPVRLQMTSAGARLSLMAWKWSRPGRFGFDEGVAGHITARDPERRDCFWVNPYAVHFSQIRVSNLSLVNHEGKVLEGQPCNAAAFAIHSRVHMARPDVVAAAHAHGVYGRSWSTFGRLLDPLTQDACAFYKDHSIFQEYNGVVYDTAEGDRIGRALGGFPAPVSTHRQRAA